MKKKCFPFSRLTPNGLAKENFNQFIRIMAKSFFEALYRLKGEIFITADKA
jgi:hypothetical protein